MSHAVRAARPARPMAWRRARRDASGPRVRAGLAAGTAALVVHRCSSTPLRAAATATASASLQETQGMGAAAAGALLRAGLEAAKALRELKRRLEVEMVQCLSDNYCPIFHHAASKVTFATRFRPLFESSRLSRSWIRPRWDWMGVVGPPYARQAP